mmetsp:Transcript_30181/g.78392  ORF Transcript_30181/g.78392 Transcript_30181/m.78392 type:complete len:337 (+) Transcript_30181:506-1516(+)
MLTCLVQVLGTHADYFIAEAQYPATEEGGDDPPPGAVPVEEKGSGCNALCYFACNDPAGDWTELPPVTPDQLVASSSIRKFFTGDLAAPVRAYPPFPGTEKEYLRAQVARVVAATILCPQGKYTIEEESAPPKVVPLESEEGYQPVPTSAMLKASSWLHYNMAILSIGRCTHPPKEEEEDDITKNDGSTLEPEVPPLTPIEFDDWSTQANDHWGSGSVVVVARSLKWPGAACAMVMEEDKCANFYVGFGHDVMPEAFIVQPPPVIKSEPDDVSEQVAFHQHFFCRHIAHMSLFTLHEKFSLSSQIDTALGEENAPILALAKTALAEVVLAAEDAEE